MEYRYLGPKCGLKVSKFILGSIPFGASGKEAYAGHQDTDLTARTIRTAMDLGVNMIDTANFYSFGATETELGKAFGEGGFDDLMVTSKVRMVMGEGPNNGGQSRWHILGQLEGSLRRLKRDHLDLYYLHEWDGDTPLEETLFTMDQLIRDGKVRYYGLSNYTGWQLTDALRVCEANGFVKPVVQQIYYTPDGRDAELDMIPAALRQGIGTNAWSPLAMGLLTGKYDRDTPEVPGARMTEGKWKSIHVRDKNKLWDLVDVLKRLAQDRGVTVAQVTLAWCTSRPGVTAAVVGARNPEQLTGSIGKPELVLDPAEIEAIDAVSPPPILYPHWHQASLAMDRPGSAQRGILESVKSRL